jgi:hypothetical protein
MAARPASPTDATIPPIVIPAETPPSELKTSKAASVRFAKDEESAARPLVGAAAPAYNFDEKLKAAYASLSKNPEEARSQYTEIYKELNQIQLPIHSLNRARCEIGLAFTYTTDDRTRLSYSGLGEASNNIVYEARDSWKDLDKAEKIATYKGLINNYKGLLILFPKSDKAAHQDINNKIQICQETLTVLEEKTPPSVSLPETPAPATVQLTSPPTVPPPAPPVSASIPLDLPPSAPESTAAPKSPAPAGSDSVPPALSAAPLPAAEPTAASSAVPLAIQSDLAPKSPAPAITPLTSPPTIPPPAPPLSSSAPIDPPPSVPESDSAPKNSASAGSGSVPPALSDAPLPLPESAAASALPKPEDKSPIPIKVTSGPVSGSSRIRNIFGLAIISLATLFIGVVIYKRFVVKK